MLLACGNAAAAAGRAGGAFPGAALEMQVPEVLSCGSHSQRGRCALAVPMEGMDVGWMWELCWRSWEQTPAALVFIPSGAQLLQPVPSDLCQGWKSVW